jgi:hypothetical protein
VREQIINSTRTKADQQAVFLSCFGGRLITLVHLELAGKLQFYLDTIYVPRTVQREVNADSLQDSSAEDFASTSSTSPKSKAVCAPHHAFTQFKFVDQENLSPTLVHAGFVAQPTWLCAPPHHAFSTHFKSVDQENLPRP